MAARGHFKSHCYMGHPLSGTNVRNRVRRVGNVIYVDRHCVTCNRKNSLAYYHKNKRLRRS